VSTLNLIIFAPFAAFLGDLCGSQRKPELGHYLPSTGVDARRLHYNQVMAPRIAIPVPHSADSDYAQRALPQYVHAVEIAGGEAVRIPLDQPAAEIKRLIQACDAVVLPGSPADVDPAKYRAAKDPHSAAADLSRDTVDELLLKDAYNLRKPVLGICYGLQILNVYRGGTLLQHIESPVNHEAGKKVRIAHTVEVESGSRLGEIISSATKAAGHDALSLPVNSSHHQAAQVVGDGLHVVAQSPQDGIIEALEGTAPDHFVVAVQWHPERSVEDDQPSRAIFRALVEAAQARRDKPVEEHAIRRG
jgi:putative glutamine amidotransferase